MKQFLLDLIEFILDLLLNRERNEIEENDEPIINEIEPPQDENKEEPTIEQEEPKQPEKPIENTSNEPYKMLSLKERQSYLKKIGLYSKKIDGIVGSGHKKAIIQFNVAFLNKNVETYFEQTDKLLREFYASYCKDAYMTDDDWKFFKNLKKKEYKCKCGGKYCNGHPHKVHKRVVIEDQYLRNVFNAPITINSGDRCKDHNKAVGGVSNSKHMGCEASDKKFQNVTANKVMKEIKTLEFNHYCYAIGTYSVHGDVKK